MKRLVSRVTLQCPPGQAQAQETKATMMAILGTSELGIVFFPAPGSVSINLRDIPTLLLTERGGEDILVEHFEKGQVVWSFTEDCQKTTEEGQNFYRFPVKNHIDWTWQLEC